MGDLLAVQCGSQLSLCYSKNPRCDQSCNMFQELVGYVDEADKGSPHRPAGQSFLPYRAVS